MVFQFDEPTRFGDVWTLAVPVGRGGAPSMPVRVTREFDALDRFALPREEKISWKSADGTTIAIADTVKGEAPGEIVHVPAPGQESVLATLSPGEEVTARIDWDRRHRHMRFHTATHLLCAIVPHQTNGCSITAQYARLDFDMVEPLDREHLERELARLVGEAHEVRTVWITDAELDAKPDLVRTMSVKPPRGVGRVRLLEIDGVDLQPCGGTHVANTREIGRLRVAKIEKKSARARRVVLEFADPAAP